MATPTYNAADPPSSTIGFRRFKELNISEIGLGCASAWGQPWFDERKALRVVDRALELGITVFDTGPTYSRGVAEPRLGKALEGKDVSGLLVSTKVGTHLDADGKLYKDWSKKAILRSINASRRRLGLEIIPLIYLHGPKPADITEGLLDTLQEARAKEMVRWWGVNSFDPDVLATLKGFRAFDVVMLDYNLLRINREPVIDELHASGKLVVAGAALANHLHSPSFLWPKSPSDVWYLLRAMKNYRADYFRARHLSFLRGLEDWTPAQAALAFVAANPAITTAMFSTTRIRHLEENVLACGKRLPPALYQKIRQTTA